MAKIQNMEKVQRLNGSGLMRIVICFDFLLSS